MFSAYQWSDILLLGIMTGATASAPFCKIKSWSQVAPMFLFTLWPTWMMGSLLKVWQSPKDPHKSIHLGRLSAKIKSSDQTELHKKRWSRSLLMPWRLPFCHLWLLTFFFFSQLEMLTAEGPVFSSGHDLKELTDARGRDYHTEVFQTCSEVSKVPAIIASMRTTMC